MSEMRVLKSMRMNHWEKAKAELNCMLNTFWGDSDHFDDIYDLITDFIKEVEQNGYQE